MSKYFWSERQVQKLEEGLRDLRKMIFDQGNFPIVKQINERVGSIESCGALQLRAKRRIER